jgi:hypothetical protein
LDRDFAEKEGFSKKPLARKKTHMPNKPKMKTTLTEDDVNLIIEPWRMLQMISYSDMEQSKKDVMKESIRS